MTPRFEVGTTPRHHGALLVVSEVLLRWWFWLRDALVVANAPPLIAERGVVAIVVPSVVVDLDPGRAVVQGTASLAQLRGTVEAAGFTVPDAPAPEG